MEFRMLGPLDVRCDGRSRAVGGPRQRAVLAALLLSTNTSVPIDWLTAQVWEEPSPAAESNLRTYLARLRCSLTSPVDGQSRILRGPSGYRLIVHDGECDLAAFEEYAARGDRAFRDGDHEATAEWYGRALALFRGEPLADVPRTPAVSAVVMALAERRDAITERWLSARIALGGDVVPELRVLVARMPERESLLRLLMLALDRDGRTTEAVSAYRAHREHLIVLLGVEPGAELCLLHERLLEPLSSFRHLPPDIADFTGRDDHIRRIVAAGEEGARVVAITGIGGVGKTRLAIRAARTLVDTGAFPDGQLYADLRGHDSGRSPAEPSTVLAGLLRQLGVGGANMPDGLAARAEVFAARLVGRRILLLLDDAVDVAQVRPLLVGGPGCLVLVTSRRTVEVGEEVSVLLGGFSDGEALSLLGRIIGGWRVATEFAAAMDLVEQCGRLPRDVAAAGHRLRTRPAWRIADLVDRLRGEGAGAGAWPE